VVIKQPFVELLYFGTPFFMLEIVQLVSGEIKTVVRIVKEQQNDE